MIIDDKIQQAGRYLAGAYMGGRPLNIMDKQFAPLNQSEAYAVQRAFLGHLSRSEGPVGGYKVAYTSESMRQRMGISEPCYGQLFSEKIFDSPTSVKSTDYYQLAIECEVAVKLSQDIEPSNVTYTLNTIEPYIEALFTSFEIVDRKPLGTADLSNDPSIGPIATNISNAGAVLGQPITKWGALDLSNAKATISVNGSLVTEGKGSDIMGHPINPLVWLANTLSEKGVTIPNNSIIITGSIAPPLDIYSGDTSEIEIEGLGKAILTVE